MKKQLTKLIFFAIFALFTNCNLSKFMSAPEPSGISKWEDEPRPTRSGPVYSGEKLPKNPTPGKCYIRCVTPETTESFEENYPVYIGGAIAPNDLGTLKLILQPAMSRWEYKAMMENCRSNDPRDCMVLCLVDYQEESQEITVVKDEEKTDFFEYQTFVLTEHIDKGGVAVWEEISA